MRRLRKVAKASERAKEEEDAKKATSGGGGRSDEVAIDDAERAKLTEQEQKTGKARTSKNVKETSARDARRKLRRWRKRMRSSEGK